MTLLHMLLISSKLAANTNGIIHNKYTQGFFAKGFQAYTFQFKSHQQAMPYC